MFSHLQGFGLGYKGGTVRIPNSGPQHAVVAQWAQSLIELDTSHSSGGCCVGYLLHVVSRSLLALSYKPTGTPQWR